MAASTGSVEEGRFRGTPAMIVTAGDIRAVFLPDLGMTGVSMQCRGSEHLAIPGGLPALRAGSTLGLPLLAPWANRLSQRRYRTGGVTVDLDGVPLRTDSNGLPIHGLLVGQPGWQVRRRSTRGGRAGFAATIDVDAPAFPFSHRIEVGVTAHDRRLTVDTTVVPTGRRAVPIAFGWHPYLQLPGTPRSRWRLRLPKRTHVALDARGIPTGTSRIEVREASAIGGRTFDDLYELGRDRTLTLETDDATISMHAARGYPYAQVWVPKGRSFAALEPMTALTNSLVEGSAKSIKPGDAYTATFTLEVGDAA